MMLAHMETRHVFTRLALVGAALWLPLTAIAQVPFSSTQSPGMNPFNRGTGLPPASTPPPRAANPPGAASPYGNNMPGYVPTASAVTGPIDPDHRLGPRDVLTYRVAEDRDDKVSQIFVTDSGEVELPLGSLRVRASGKTTQQLSADIKSLLEREYYKPGHATVFLGLVSTAPNASKGKVYFTGEIASKGAIDLPADGQLTVYQAILQLGGFTQDANMKGVFLYRKGGPKDGQRIDCKAISNGDSAQDVILQPGDTVKVKKKLFDWQM